MNKTIIQENLPKHIAITMDGNGRWAKEKGKNRIFGHNQKELKLLEILSKEL